MEKDEEQIVLDAVRITSYRKGYYRATEDLLEWLTVQASRQGDTTLDRATAKRLRDQVREGALRPFGEKAFLEFVKRREGKP